jgi:hypothetical protein
MPDIGDIMDVNIEDLSPEQQQQLKNAADHFQQKCLLSFKKNRSGIPYLKNEMPRVYCQERVTLQLSRKGRNACKRFEMPRITSKAGIIKLSWVRSNR